MGEEQLDLGLKIDPLAAYLAISIPNLSIEKGNRSLPKPAPLSKGKKTLKKRMCLPGWFFSGKCKESFLK